MSRLYDNKPLRSIPVSDFKWDEQWQPESFQSGRGVIIEGDIKKRSRHVVIDSAQKKVRYFVLHIKPQRAHRRVFDSSGKEIEPNFSESAKVRTGHLHSSYKVVSKGESDVLSATEVCTLLGKDTRLSQVTKKWQQVGCVALWSEEVKLESVELDVGDAVRIKTCGDGPFIDSLAKMDVQSSTVSNYAGGESLGASWTDKVMMVKTAGQDKPLPQDQNEGVDEDEWDD